MPFETDYAIDALVESEMLHAADAMSDAPLTPKHPLPLGTNEEEYQCSWAILKVEPRTGTCPFMLVQGKRLVGWSMGVNLYAVKEH